MVDKRVLAVEDDSILAEYIGTVLSDLGYAVLGPVATGREAIDQAQTQRPDLILMDIKLAGDMDGIAAARRIQSFSDVPIIYLTGCVDDPVLEQAKSAVPYGYLVKPVSQRELAATMEMAFYRHSLDVQLKETYNRLDLALASAQMNVWEWNVAADEVIWSNQSNGASRWTKPAKTFQSFMAMVHPEDVLTVRHAIRRVSADSPHFKGEFRILDPTGSVDWISYAGLGRFDQTGTLVRVVGTTRDITERKRAQEEARSCAAELEAIFAAQNDAVLAYDTGMNVYRTNPAFTSVYGFEPVGLDLRDIARRLSGRWLDGRPLLWEEQPMARALWGEKVTGACFLLRRAQGLKVIVEASADPVCVEGRIVGAVTVWHDVTARQQAEEALFRVTTEHEEELRRTFRTIKKVFNDRMRETADIIKGVLDEASRPEEDSDAGSLTNREREVLALIAEGKSSQVIADRLFISIHTVNRHRANIMEKLKLSKAVDLLKYAVSRGYASG